MSQITTGIRSILNYPVVYNFLKLCLGSNSAQQEYVRKYIRPSVNNKILDIGCGTADILKFLPTSIDYYGVDLSLKYIDYAKRRFGKCATFICNDANSIINTLPSFDIILATGLLHHLNDHEVSQLFNMAATHLTETGRIITLDCCYTENQSKIAKMIINYDRGQNIRSPECYKAFASHSFEKVTTHIRHDMLRIPYTHIIMECSGAIPRCSNDYQHHN